MKNNERNKLIQKAQSDHKKIIEIASKETITDEEIEELSKILEFDVDETTEMLRSLPKQDDSILKIQPEFYTESMKDSMEKYNMKEAVVDVRIDPITGMKDMYMENNDDKERIITMSELLEGKTMTDNEALDLIRENLDVVTVGGQDVSNDDIREVFTFMERMRTNDILPKDRYQELPSIMKQEIINMEKVNGAIPMDAKNQLVQEFYESMKMSLQMDQEFIDLEESIKKELDYDILDQYLDNIVEVMEVKMLESAEVLDDENPEKAESLRQVSKSFTKAYTYDRLFDKIKNKSGVVNRDMKRDLKRYDNRCSRFNRMYKSSNFVITDIRIIAPILDRLMPDHISMDDIKKFVLLMISEFLRLDPDKIEEHTEMYYSIKMIEALDYIGSDDSRMKKVILNNIEQVITEINNN